MAKKATNSRKTSTAKGHANRGVSNEDQEIGRRIRLIRIDRKLSQEELGNALGVSFQQVQKYEKGSNRVSSGRLMDIAQKLSTSPHELMGWNQKGETAAIDVESYKLAKSFLSLHDEWKPAIRQLITVLMKDAD